VLASALSFASPLSPSGERARQSPPRRHAGPPTVGGPNPDHAITLAAFAHRVSCRYAVRFAHRCLHSPSLHGWDFKGEHGYTGLFKLTRRKSTIWLEDAGGTARSLDR
jgi:hypothetical protein